MPLFFFLGSFCLSAQKADTIHVRSPKIVHKLKPGKMVSFGDKSIEFIKVISDSRCPREVTCVWAGEATVLVGIYENGKLIERKEVTLQPRKEILELFSANNKLISAYSLDPYPKIKTPNASEYMLNVLVTNIVE